MKGRACLFATGECAGYVLEVCIKARVSKRVQKREPTATLLEGGPMIVSIHTTPIPDPLADPTRDPEGDPLVPPSPGHHNDEPQRPEGPPDKDPV
jgi:hypothetical protein